MCKIISVELGKMTYRVGDALASSKKVVTIFEIVPLTQKFVTNDGEISFKDILDYAPLFNNLGINSFTNLVLSGLTKEAFINAEANNIEVVLFSLGEDERSNKCKEVVTTLNSKYRTISFDGLTIGAIFTQK